MKKQTEYWLKTSKDDLTVIKEIIENEQLTNTRILSILKLKFPFKKVAIMV